jgi:D-alanyl-D-alanine carboxypeptidase (penicillin-binding protein 5/6)
VDADKFLEISGALDEKIYPASITKLFTCYVAMQYLQPDTVLTVGEELSKVGWGSSVAGLVRGDQLTVAQLTEAMLLPSGNDAAYVLAVNAGRVIMGDPNAGVDTALASFMQTMNAQAKAVGMTGTNFVNPDGIHKNKHYSTFADLALLGKLSLQNPTIMEMAKIAEDQVAFVYTAPRQNNAQEVGHWKNTNVLIDPTSEYYCPYATGLKTGKTPDAGNCLMSSFEYNGRTLIIGVFGCPKGYGRFNDTTTLYEELIEN